MMNIATKDHRSFKAKPPHLKLRNKKMPVVEEEEHSLSNILPMKNSYMG
jgi:hypothetical protein